jgi:micrococcal nuclease
LFVVIVTAVTGTQSDWLQSGVKVAEQNQPGLYRVEEVSDGDTIIVNMNGYREIVRMIGVDTPETQHPKRPLECYGKEASEYSRKLLENKRVRLQADPLDTNRDRYGRLLRYVFLPDGILVESRLIADGYGFAYTLFPFEKSDEFKTLEQQAKDAGSGLWSACEVTVEANGHQQTNPVSSDP